MSSHFLFHSNASETVPFNARYSFPTQASRIIESNVKIPPRTGTSMGSASAPLDASAKGRLIQITLPSQGYLNPLESYLRFDLVLSSKSGSITALAPRPLPSIHSMFRRLRILYGSLVIEDIQNYNALVRILTNVAVEAEYQKGPGAIMEGMGTDAARGQLFQEVCRGPIGDNTLSVGHTSSAPSNVGATGTNMQKSTAGQLIVQSTGEFCGDLTIPTASSVGRVLPPPGVAAVLYPTVIDQTGGNGFATGANPPVPTFFRHTFTINLASGLLTQAKLIPLKWMANQLTIELELDEPAAFLVTGHTTEVPTNTVSILTAAVAESNARVQTLPGLSDEIVPAHYQRFGSTEWSADASANTNGLLQAGGAAAVTANGLGTAESTNKANLGYFMENISYVATILEFDSTYDAAFYQGMLAGGVPIKFASWHTHQHVPSGSQTVLTIQERARSVKSAFAVIRNRQDLDPVQFLSDPYWSYPGTGVASASTYWREFTNGIDEYQWRIGGRYFPSQPVKCGNGGAEPLIELQKALNVMGDYSLGVAIKPENWFKPRGTFVIPMEFESSNGMEMSGINAEELADLALVIKLVNNATFDPQAFVNTFVSYDSMIILRPNNVLELVQ